MQIGIKNNDKEILILSIINYGDFAYNKFEILICKIYIIFGVHKMSEKFMHVGKFIVKPENQQAFYAYQHNALNFTGLATAHASKALWNKLFTSCLLLKR